MAKLLTRDLEDYVRIHQQVNSLKRQEERLKKKIKDALRGIPGRKAERNNIQAELVTYRGPAPWKEEFIRMLGEAEAERVRAAAPRHERLRIRND